MISLNNRLNPKQLIEMFWTFFKIGAFTLGGGFAMIPLIKDEFVDKQKWIKEDEFLDTIAITQSAPGAVAINVSIFIGYKLSGYIGAIVAAFGIVLPSFLIILFVALFYTDVKSNLLVQKAFKGIFPAIVVLILSAAFNLRKAAFEYRSGVWITVISLFSLIITNLHPIFVILTAGVVGIIFNKALFPQRSKDDDIS